MSLLKNLSKDILVKIVQKLENKDIINLYLTCKQIHFVLINNFRTYTIVYHEWSKKIIMIIDHNHKLYHSLRRYLEFEKNRHINYYSFISSAYSTQKLFLCEIKYRVTHREPDRQQQCLIIYDMDEHKQKIKQLTITKGHKQKIIYDENNIINWFTNEIIINVIKPMKIHNIDIYNNHADDDDNPKEFDELLKQFKNKIEQNSHHYFWNIDANNTYMNTYLTDFYLPSLLINLKTNSTNAINEDIKEDEKGIRLIAKGYKYMFDSNIKNNQYDENYFIHDNGATPFMVSIDSKYNGVKVFKVSHKELFTHSHKELFTHLVIEYTNVSKIFLGHNLDENDKGNSILLRLENDVYIHIGIDIYSFTLPQNDKIITYYSEIGNNDVPYPVAVGEKNAYFMLDYVYIKKSGFPENVDWKNGYSYFYGHRFNSELYSKRMKGIQFENLQYIHYRDW